MGKATILVVDDSATVRQQVGLALGQAGYDVIEAADGVDGLETARNHTEISMIILDVNMPNKNGLEMLEELKAASQFARLPVLMLTTEGHVDLIKRAKAAGATGWIVKPFDASQLVATVEKLTSASV